MNSNKHDSQHNEWFKSHCDIMAEMKGNRFYVVDSELLEENENPVIILSDMAYWNKNFDQLHKWCIENLVEISGMALIFDDPIKMTAFILKWS